MMTVNDYMTGGLLATFSHIDQMDPAFHLPLMELLHSLLEKAESPTVLLTLKRIISGNPGALRVYDNRR